MTRYTAILASSVPRETRAAVERTLAAYAWTDALDDYVAAEHGITEAQVRAVRRAHERRLASVEPDVSLVARTLLDAQRRNGEPLDANLISLAHQGADLVLTIARETGVRLRWIEGGPAIEIGDRAFRIPSELAAVELAQLVYLHTDTVPDEDEVNRAMEILEARASARSEAA